jgi:hypothetical protein
MCTTKVLPLAKMTDRRSHLLLRYKERFARFLLFYGRASGRRTRLVHRVHHVVGMLSEMQRQLRV